MHEGHRQRMIERLAAGADTLQDHEIVEILLFNAIPRKNTNEIAHALLDRFGSIGELLQAEIGELCKVKGVGESVAAYLKTIGLVYRRSGAAFPAVSVPKGYTAKDFHEFLKNRYRDCESEVFEIFCLDERGRLFDVRRFTSGLTDRVWMDASSVIRYISEKTPAKVMIAHTHPDGDASPSRADDDITKKLLFLCEIQNVVLYDHMIVAKNAYYSYFQSNRLNELRAKKDF